MSYLLSNFLCSKMAVGIAAKCSERQLYKVPINILQRDLQIQSFLIYVLDSKPRT